MAGAIAAEMLNAFFVNYFFIFLYILVILFIRAQYRKYSELQSAIYGKPAKSLKEITEQIILTGLIAGFVSSFFTVVAGITIEADTVRYLFYVMCVMLLFDLRFVCISYAAGILGAFSLITGILKVNIPSLLCLVGILQLVEGVLIWLNRKGECVPVFIRVNDEIAGAFLIRRFWMIPVVFFTYLMQPGLISLDFASGWHLIFKGPPLTELAYVLGLDCLVAVLCQNDIAVTRHPEKKSIQSAFLMICYSAGLLALSWLSLKTVWVGYVGVAYCILAHEAISLYSNLSEKRGVPLYSAVRRGLRIMEVLPGGHAELMGLKRGDIILGINGHDIQTEEGVNEALREFPTYTWINVSGWDGKERTVEYNCYPGGYNSLGIVCVPREREVTYNTAYIERVSILQNIVNRFRGMDKPV
ncbi:MAG TPA: PDZ domain-containing protein [Clostridia bacterium]|nr:PDZ domain-containing protein [Clostridia bacterium]